MVSILIIEDNKSQRLALEEFLSQISELKLSVYSAENGEIAYSILNTRKIDLILSDLMLPDTTGIEIVKKTRAQYLETPIVIMTGEPSIETAVDAIREGADDYLLKPVDLFVLKKKVLTLLETQNLKQENKELRERLNESFDSSNIIGNSNLLRELLEKCKQVAPSDVSVLIEGESGTGKELIANLLHQNSLRARKPFIKVNCGAITKTILESELFGVVKGAYTGANASRAGYFEAANGGSIFLDEIAEMDLESQVRLLRVLEEKEVTRIGSTSSIPVDVRIIAATNQNLLEAVENNAFREDLYYRLAVIKLHSPALRDRIQDIALLFNHMLIQFNDKYNKSVQGMSDELRRFFEGYHWPGNIRQFRNTIEGMIVLATDDILEKKDLPAELLNTNTKASQDKQLSGLIPGLAFEEYEKMILLKNLNFYNHNREKTAASLGISERTLYRKIKEYNI